MTANNDLPVLVAARSQARLKLLEFIYLPASRYHSRAYRRYVRAVMNSVLGEPSFGATMAAHMFMDMHRPGFCRMMLVPGAAEEYGLQRMAFRRIVNNYVKMVEAQLLPYCRNYDYQTRTALITQRMQSNETAIPKDT